MVGDVNLFFSEVEQEEQEGDELQVEAEETK
jgi:hypothetical protein